MRNRIAAFVRGALGLYSPSVDLMPALAAYYWETEGRYLMAYLQEVHDLCTQCLDQQREHPTPTLSEHAGGGSPNIESGR